MTPCVNVCVFVFLQILFLLFFLLFCNSLFLSFLSFSFSFHTSLPNYISLPFCFVFLYGKPGCKEFANINDVSLLVRIPICVLLSLLFTISLILLNLTDTHLVYVRLTMIIMAVCNVDRHTILWSIPTVTESFYGKGRSPLPNLQEGWTDYDEFSSACWWVYGKKLISSFSFWLLFNHNHDNILFLFQAFWKRAKI